LAPTTRFYGFGANRPRGGRCIGFLLEDPDTAAAISVVRQVVDGSGDQGVSVQPGLEVVGGQPRRIVMDVAYRAGRRRPVAWLVEHAVGQIKGDVGVGVVDRVEAEVASEADDLGIARRLGPEHAGEVAGGEIPRGAIGMNGVAEQGDDPQEDQTGSPQASPAWRGGGKARGRGVQTVAHRESERWQDVLIDARMAAERIEAQQRGGEAGREGSEQEQSKRAVAAGHGGKTERSERQAHERGDAGVAEREREQSSEGEVGDPSRQVAGRPRGRESVAEVLVQRVGLRGGRLADREAADDDGGGDDRQEPPGPGDTGARAREPPIQDQGGGGAGEDEGGRV
jgi:hypothetical protein